MKKYRSLLPIAGIAMLTFVGCGTANNNNTRSFSPSSTNTSTVTNTSAKTPSTKKFSETKTKSVYSDEQLASMTPSQLAQYRTRNGTALPFASNNVFRSTPQKGTSMFGTTIIPVNGGYYQSADFTVVDSWSGTVQGHTFLLEVDKKKDGVKYIVGMMYRKMSKSIALDKQPWITNFTGSYVVFSTPNPAQGNPMYAINLINGNILQNDNVWIMSGVGTGGYPSGISGLSKSYDTFPNGRSSY